LAKWLKLMRQNVPIAAHAWLNAPTPPFPWKGPPRLPGNLYHHRPHAFLQFGVQHRRLLPGLLGRGRVFRGTKKEASWGKFLILSVDLRIKREAGIVGEAKATEGAGAGEKADGDKGPWGFKLMGMMHLGSGSKRRKNYEI
jgi:hypothetical protein